MIEYCKIKEKNSHFFCPLTQSRNGSHYPNYFFSSALLFFFVFFCKVRYSLLFYYETLACIF